jgi:signal transduction histidine kinase
VIVPDLRHYRAGAGGVLRQAGLRSLVHVPLITRGMSLGTMCVASVTLRDFGQEEVSLLMAVGNQIALGVENARLYGEIARREQLRGELLQKVIMAQEDERKRIARDLHDDTSQSITALIYSLEAAEGSCPTSETRSTLTSMRQLATQTLEGIHKLIFDLRPSMLDHLGLFVAVRWYAESRLEPAGVRVHIEETDGGRRLPAQTETALFRVAQEAINNIARHSGARNVTIRLSGGDSAVSIELADDGIGFDPSEVSRVTDQTRGLGLVGMEERVGLLGGDISIVSEPGSGTRVVIRVPTGSHVPAAPALQVVR